MTWGKEFKKCHIPIGHPIPAVLNLWAAAQDICLVGRDQTWKLRIFFDVSHMPQSMNRYQVLVVELELPLHT